MIKLITRHFTIYACTVCHEFRDLEIFKLPCQNNIYIQSLEMNTVVESFIVKYMDVH